MSLARDFERSPNNFKSNIYCRETYLQVVEIKKKGMGFYFLPSSYFLWAANI